MTIPTDALSEEYTIDTPENVSIGYSVAGIGNRFIAALIDSALLGAALIMIQILLLVALAGLGAEAFLFDDADLGWEQGLVVALYALGSFSLIWGYFILFEWLWRGQTPGKRV
ncbi:MAG: RDD family protein, partial [Litorilinea sp.]